MLGPTARRRSRGGRTLQVPSDLRPRARRRWHMRGSFRSQTEWVERLLRRAYRSSDELPFSRTVRARLRRRQSGGRRRSRLLRGSMRGLSEEEPYVSLMRGLPAELGLDRGLRLYWLCLDACPLSHLFSSAFASCKRRCSGRWCGQSRQHSSWRCMQIRAAFLARSAEAFVVAEVGVSLRNSSRRQSSSSRSWSLCLRRGERRDRRKPAQVNARLIQTSDRTRSHLMIPGSSRRRMQMSSVPVRTRNVLGATATP